MNWVILFLCTVVNTGLFIATFWLRNQTLVAVRELIERLEH